MIRRYATPLLIATSVVVVDQLTKWYAANNFADADVEVIPGFLTLTFVENPGAAFSLFPDAGVFLGVAAIVVVIGILWTLRKDRAIGERVVFGLIIGGAVGNLVDRVYRGEGILDGKVIDWIDLWWIPTFNLADTAVTTSVFLLVILGWRSSRTS